jgi:hypothetical protein
LSRFPVPKGTKIGNQSVRDAVDSGLATMAAELTAAVSAWDDTTRQSTMDKAIERWQAISFKVDAYGEYLESSQSKLKETLEAAKESLKAKILAVGEAKETKQAEKKAEKQAAKTAEETEAQPLFPASELPAETTGSTEGTAETEDSPADFPEFALA